MTRSTVNTHPETMHRILIGVGSNIDPESHVLRALGTLNRIFPKTRTSTFYRTKPLGGRNQQPYWNGVVAATTSMSVEEVRTQLGRVEKENGRKRDPGDSYAARTIDLDLLAYDHVVRPDIDLPSYDLLARDFCLIPAAEVMPRWIPPGQTDPLEKLARKRFPVCPNIIGVALKPDNPAGKDNAELHQLDADNEHEEGRAGKPSPQ